MSISGSSWLKFGLFTVGLGQSFVFVLVPPLARDLGLSVIQTSSIFAISALGWALTSAFWGRASDKYGRRNIAILGLVGYSISLIALITPLFLAEKISKETIIGTKAACQALGHFLKIPIFYYFNYMI